MSCLSISNIEALREYAALSVSARTIARSVMPNVQDSALVSVDSDRAPKAGWSVLRDTNGNGIAIHVGQIVPSDTPLAGIVARLRSAQAVSRFLEEPELRGFVMVEDDVLSPEWRSMAVHVGGAILWVGLVGNWAILSKVEEPSHGKRPVRITLLGHLDEQVPLRPDSEVDFSEFRLEFADRGLNARIVTVQGGSMKVRIDEEPDQEFAWAPSVRLELGELEMKFEDLLALQPGNMIEVEVPRPIRAYLRVGQSQLAVGEIEIRETGVVVTVVEVF
jgi:hypothetical protein